MRHIFHRFTLQQALPHNHQAPRGRSAAVLVGLYRHQHQWQVLLTQRALHLRHHKGQISFPGGKVEPTDPSLVHTALRETQEEVGLTSEFINVLGTLPTFHTGSGFTITPILAKLQPGFNLTADPNEVKDIFFMPLNQIKQKQHCQVTLANKPHDLVFIRYQQRLIWGATAAILDNLYRHLS
ncbi:CoA pyrophosphatase [Motilimonas sp. 1_MG-2023]|uniref:CoA pyrophosphatase n=1 Tax=Motilimonas TaxID=1914248 RepID=UPI001E35AFF9|nr:CoA pyrophosphatase [Motilimonas sp. 1_MG-2023]MCE0556972.1 CoA pyrophosphatase [Motilimonas sp. E26]MDO6525477.1 CoA pyrophosphatase [Motilimonas sp. 1_MG-2023]